MGLASHHTWDLGDRIVFFGDICWFLKDFSWVLLLPFASIPFGVLSMSCSAFAVARRLGGPLDVLLPEVLSLVWLSSNFVWMVGDVFWDSPDQQTPWALTPVISDQDWTYSRVQAAATCGFLAGASLFPIGLALSVALPPLRKGRVFWRLLSSFHLASWCLKDYFWTLEMLTCGLLADLATVASLLLAASGETGAGFRGVGRADLSWILWVFSSGVWMLCELECEYDLTMRYVAAGLTFLAAGLMAFSYEQVRDRASAAREAAAAGPAEPWLG